jgi:hypothetical protein
MKSIIAYFLFSTSVFAAKMPDTLICKGRAIYVGAQSFTIYHVNSKSPVISITDASFEDQSAQHGEFSVSFSNECDNMYTMTFSQADLDALSQGKVSSIRGSMDYDAGGYENPRTGEDSTTEKNVEIFCIKK